VVSPNSSLSDALSFSPEIEMEDGLNCSDLFDFHWISTEDPDQDNVKVEFATPMPPNIPKVEAYTSNESSMSDYSSFTQVVRSLPPMEGVDLDFDEIECDDSGQSDGPWYRFILCIENSLWCHFMMKKDLQVEYLRRHLELKISICG